MAAASLATLQACSSVPDAVNPVEWYKGTRDWVSGEDSGAKAGKAATDAPEMPGKDRPFPNVSTVPEAPRKSTEEERKKAAQSLIADRERARYTDEVIRRQTASPAPVAAPAAEPEKTAPQAAAEPPARAPSATATAEARRPASEPRRSTPAPAASASPPAVPSPPMRAEPVQPPTQPAPPMRAEPMPPPALSQRSAPPPPAAPQVARLPPPPPLPAPPAAAPSSTPPSQLVFGPPPADIDIVRNQRNGLAGNAPGSSLSIESLLPPRGAGTSPAPAPAITAAPDPSSLDPASQVAVVTFEQGSSKLSGTSRRIIREVVEMQHERGGRVHVIGHSSSWTRDMNLVRHNMINFGLSLDRANAVARELLRHGIAARDLSIGAMSDARPLFFEVMPSGEAGNRRVEIFLDGG